MFPAHFGLLCIKLQCQLPNGDQDSQFVTAGSSEGGSAMDHAAG